MSHGNGLYAKPLPRLTGINSRSDASLAPLLSTRLTIIIIVAHSLSDKAAHQDTAQEPYPNAVNIFRGYMSAELQEFLPGLGRVRLTQSYMIA